MSRPSDLPPAAFGESSGFGPAGFLAETAYAKINLALHVRARREDGYHELETFFAFVDAGDELVASPALADGLTLRGEFAPQLEGEDGNLVLDALARRSKSFGLPEGSWLLDTGGFKGQSRDIPLEEFYAQLATALGVPRRRCIRRASQSAASRPGVQRANPPAPLRIKQKTATGKHMGVPRNPEEEWP